MPYLDPYIDAESVDDYERIIADLYQRHQALDLQLQTARSRLILYQGICGISSLLMIVFIFLLHLLYTG